MTGWLRLGGRLALAGQLALLAPGASAAEAPRDTTAHRPPLELRVPEPEGPPVTGLVIAGAGLLGGVALAAVLKDKADDAYDRYLLTADPDAARAHLDDAERYDRLSVSGWVVAQVSFVAFLYLLTRERERPLVPVEGEPVVRTTDDGVQVGWRVGP